jgi:transposase
MPFQLWQPPSSTALQLRAITRHIAALTQQHTRESNRLHAALASTASSACVRQDLKRSLRDLEHRAEKMRDAALTLIEQDAELRPRFALLLSMPGIGEISALNLLGELALLAPGLTVRQWVAHSGLDPAHHDSGSSVHRPSRISRVGNRYLRRALYMPALVAVRHDPHLRAFYQALLARHKAKLQALWRSPAKCYTPSSGCSVATPTMTAHSYCRTSNSLSSLPQFEKRGSPASLQRKTLDGQERIFPTPGKGRAPHRVYIVLVT